MSGHHVPDNVNSYEVKKGHRPVPQIQCNDSLWLTNAHRKANILKHVSYKTEKGTLLATKKINDIRWIYLIVRKRSIHILTPTNTPLRNALALMKD